MERPLVQRTGTVPVQQSEGVGTLDTPTLEWKRAISFALSDYDCTCER